MKTKYLLALVTVTLLGAQMCLAGSVKGKVSPGKSVVYLEAAPGVAIPPSDKTVTMDQKGLTFQPHVLVVQVGTSVEFLNSDKVQHNVFWPHISGDKKKTHNMGTWPQGQKRPFKFTDPGVVALLCNVHPEMSGYIIVSPTPYFAETDAAGEYTIANVPDGQYTVNAWHEGKKVQSKKITVGGATSADFTLQ
ncbi:MAG TPA: carboxypeptidase regulatory-like domain-containing protein [Alphaproteobacteria bacterium]|nr:carboxypeptidase regulatory-like domain-containing protein [Alphaproteobacteria bacterium]